MAYLFKPIGRLNVAKKSKKAKRGAKKEGMKKVAPARKKKKPAPTPAPIAPSPLLGSLGGKPEDQ